MIKTVDRNNIKIDNHHQILKMVVLFICLIVNVELALCQQIIHKDPYGIKKTNISGFLFIRPTGVVNAGPQMRISHYFATRFMALYNVYYGLTTENWEGGYAGFEWGPAK